MKGNLDKHPIRQFFADSLHSAICQYTGPNPDEQVESYLTDMLVRLLSMDGIYLLRDSYGHRVTGVAEMVSEGDIRLRANSFGREREVHKHLGDFLLFWSGVFPEFLKKIKGEHSADALIDPIGQGRRSYYVASTFDHAPYSHEAPIFLRLSEEFELYQQCLWIFRKEVLDC